ncbi:hypothetical protein A3D77_05020 [Candidatus Gottesmanbacteria bacterium RIFCSPHIGHO2_02_FULL_39_11]|uniref:DUF5678 domain-containing protein n=1 Tax=Candidatus Gottesmanbacteria bacterium RIFCSPHIGHO2_02_FULL_39_11 TaxID=1798382 RepID=A0A1F5ZMV8_9BACT|nr:MAG: hypothetical protein A3D77_05020 [Candidatus Gottesmanbacteria bacterium RIFCSPHIGHO2_02_FULL_39_11]
MKRVNVPTSQMGKFEGKWVAIKDDRIIAVGKTLDEIGPLVSGTKEEKNKIPAYSFKVPYKDEGPYILSSFD